MMHVLTIVLSLALTPLAKAFDVEPALQRAGDNRIELERALAEVKQDQRSGMAWLIEHMPDRDLQTLDADFLLDNVRNAYAAWRSAPWHDAISEAMFFDTILPYASINERRDNWRADFRRRFAPLVAEAKSPAQAAAILNNQMFGLIDVKYSTKRPKADQSPFESIDAGMASCTGLTVLLIDACRSVGVPSRFVGTPLWSDGSGNHSWVEVWDDGWHCTGAAEPTGDELGKAWFLNRASKASRDDPRNAIYAVTWRHSPIYFPMVWQASDHSVGAVDVTDRYTVGAQPTPAGKAIVRFRALGADGQRVGREVAIRVGDEVVFDGKTRDEGFDANDHAYVILPIGAECSIEWEGPTKRFTVAEEDALITLQDVGKSLDPKRSNQAVRELRGFLRSGEGAITEQSFANVPLTKRDAARAKQLLWNAHEKRITTERSAEMKARELQLGDKTMPFWYTSFGEKPRDGRSLWISMHGGGGAPEHVNTQQWNNQKRLYTLEEGIYLAPRAPTDTWNLWHQKHIDDFFDRLIENLIVLEEVDPNRIYIIGYSAGGDGVYQLAPRFADRLAAAGMMAGHPNETKPDGLRNLPFTLHMGANDGAYKRNDIGAQWKQLLADLHEQDPEGYDHWVELHEGKGHWMDRQDAAALPWMAKRTRNLRPKKIVWLQDDVLHNRYYWLAVDEPIARARVVVERDGQTISILEGDGPLRLRLDDEMLDLDAPVIVKKNGKVVFKGQAPRTIATIGTTLAERGDPSAMFCAELVAE